MASTTELANPSARSAAKTPPPTWASTALACVVCVVAAFTVARLIPQPAVPPTTAGDPVKSPAVPHVPAALELDSQPPPQSAEGVKPAEAKGLGLTAKDTPNPAQEKDKEGLLNGSDWQYNGNGILPVWIRQVSGSTKFVFYSSDMVAPMSEGHLGDPEKAEKSNAVYIETKRGKREGEILKDGTLIRFTDGSFLQRRGKVPMLRAFFLKNGDPSVVCFIDQDKDEDGTVWLHSDSPDAAANVVRAFWDAGGHQLRTAARPTADAAHIGMWFDPGDPQHPLDPQGYPIAVMGPEGQETLLFPTDTKVSWVRSSVKPADGKSRLLGPNPAPSK